MKVKVVSKGFDVDGGVFQYADGIIFTSDPACRDYDWLVAYDDLSGTEELACPVSRTILATCEPVSIKNYSRGFVRQFGLLLTNRPRTAENHPGWHLGRGYYKWFCGRTLAEAREMAWPEKTKDVTVVCSSKSMRHTRHADRLRLIRHLSENMPNLDWFGHGVRPFGRKFEVTDPYRYQVVVENHIAPHHWTEKLTDAFLSGCLPFYAGAPDIADDFPREAFVPIPIDDPPAALEIIRSAVSAGEYEKRREALGEARRLVLERYNFYSQVCAVIRAAGGEAGRGAPDGRARVIRPRRAVRLHDPLSALEDAFGHLRRVLFA